MTIKTVQPQPVEMFSGDSKLFTVTVLDQDNAVVVLTGASAAMTISTSPKKNVIITKVGTIVDDLAGIISFDLDPADTAAIKGVHHYEMEITDVGGRKSTVAYGSLNIKEDTTV